jgi:Tfp pilus assembly protein FimT
MFNDRKHRTVFPEAVVSTPGDTLITFLIIVAIVAIIALVGVLLIL